MKMTRIEGTDREDLVTKINAELAAQIVLHPTHFVLNRDLTSIEKFGDGWLCYLWTNPANENKQQVFSSTKDETQWAALADKNGFVAAILGVYFASKKA